MVEEELLLNFGTQIGVIAKVDGVQKHQLESLLASLESIRDDRKCLLLTAAFAERQFQRGLLGSQTARKVVGALKELYQKGATRKEARKMLGIAKWIYEASEGKNRESLQKVKSIEDFVNLISARG